MKSLRAQPGPGATLLVVDVQKGMDDPSWGPRNNPALERNLAALLAAWRADGRPVIHVRHDSLDPDSTLHPARAGNAPKAEALERRGEPVVRKSVHSAFVGTQLTDLLVATGTTELVICGVQTNYCVASTARMAGNLGYVTFVAGDACATFDQKDASGRRWSADDLHDVALMELDGEFATVAKTQDLLPAPVPRPAPRFASALPASKPLAY